MNEAKKAELARAEAKFNPAGLRPWTLFSISLSMVVALMAVVSIAKSGVSPIELAAVGVAVGGGLIAAIVFEKLTKSRM